MGFFFTVKCLSHPSNLHWLTTKRVDFWEIWIVAQLMCSVTEWVTGLNFLISSLSDGWDYIGHDLVVAGINGDLTKQISE